MSTIILGLMSKLSEIFNIGLFDNTTYENMSEVSIISKNLF